VAEGEKFLLTEREFEVLSLLAKGYPSKRIGTELAITTGTVEAHITNIFRKLKVSRRTEAVRKAREEGWLNNTTTFDQTSFRDIPNF
jgi:DNA-binding NarL/FixJ family response regulator